jgi:Sec-independent protein translocase protein TatA
MDLFRLLILGLVGLLLYGAVKIQMRMNELKDSIL